MNGTKIKLSDALLKGAANRKQARGSLQCNGAVCALGAIAVGAGLPLEYDAIKDFFPVLRTEVQYQKRTGRGPALRRKESLADHIIRLNDAAKQTFGSIAAYLRRRGL